MWKRSPALQRVWRHYFAMWVKQKICWDGFKRIGSTGIRNDNVTKIIGAESFPASVASEHNTEYWWVCEADELHKMTSASVAPTWPQLQLSHNYCKQTKESWWPCRYENTSVWRLAFPGTEYLWVVSAAKVLFPSSAFQPQLVLSHSGLYIQCESGWCCSLPLVFVYLLHVPEHVTGCGLEWQSHFSRRGFRMPDMCFLLVLIPRSHTTSPS